MIHYMNLVPSAFCKIAEGSKTIELRLNDEKRQKLNCGDTIIFTSKTFSNKVQAKIKRLYKFQDFKALYKALPIEKCGYSENELNSAHYSDMENFYTKEQIEKYGALGIELYEIVVCKNEKICYCGHDCSSCVTYIATQTDDDSLREQSQSFYKEQFRIDIHLEKFNCCGGRTDNVFELCQDCPFRKCCIERNISSCNLCPEYPCVTLKDYQIKYVNKCNQIKEG